VACFSALVLLVLAPLAAAQAGRTLLSEVIVSAVGDGANISLTFTCPAHYLSHTPAARGRDLVVRLDATDLCGGLDAAVLGAETRRVRAGELANLIEVEYDGESASGPELTLHFAREMQFRVQSQTNLRELIVSVSMPGPDRVAPVAQATGRFVINLRSSNQPSTAADLETLKAYAGYAAYQTQTEVQGRTWYRLRIGFFDTEKEAKAASLPLRTDYPGLWIGLVEDSEVQAALAEPLVAPADAAVANVPTAVSTVESANRALAPAAAAEAESPEKRAVLLEEGKRALTGGELSQAVQIFTKLLQKTDDESAEVAQELLGVARERNGQTAHAKAAYEQYLERYPEGEGATRVRQRLTALTASTSGRSSITATSPGTHAENSSAWDFDTSLWQYYQHQVAQANDDPSLLSEFGAAFQCRSQHAAQRRAHGSSDSPFARLLV
jgi:tetratricopeptide (TPR) repeat protein